MIGRSGTGHLRQASKRTGRNHSQGNTRVKIFESTHKGSCFLKPRGPERAQVGCVSRLPCAFSPWPRPLRGYKLILRLHLAFPLSVSFLATDTSSGSVRRILHGRFACLGVPSSRRPLYRDACSIHHPRSRGDFAVYTVYTKRYFEQYTVGNLNHSCRQLISL